MKRIVIPLDKARKAREAWTDEFGVEPREWHCPCGCGAVTLYLRDAEALWLAPLDSEDGELDIRGVATRAELDDFIARVRALANRRGVPTWDVDSMQETFVEAFAD